MGLRSKITLALLLGTLLLATIPSFSFPLAYADHDHDHDHDHHHDHHGNGGGCGGGTGGGSGGASGGGSTGGSGPGQSSAKDNSNPSFLHTPAPLGAPAPASVAPTGSERFSRLRTYPQYYQSVLVVLMVSVVNSTSQSVTRQFAVGTPLIIQFSVTNSSGYPVTLSPSRGTFSFTNSSGASYVLAEVVVSPVSNQPGNYTYSLTLNSHFPQGLVTAAVVADSLRDAEGEIGPSTTIASHNSQSPFDQTPNSFDNSIFAIIPPFAYIPPATFPSLVLALILLTLILQVKIRRGKKGAKRD